MMEDAEEGIGGCKREKRGREKGRRRRISFIVDDFTSSVMDVGRERAGRNEHLGNGFPHFNIHFFLSEISQFSGRA